MRQLSRFLSDVGLRCDEVLFNSGRATTFYTPRIWRSEIFRRFNAYWEASFTIFSSVGFIGPFSDLARNEILARLTESFTPELLEDLETAYLRAIAGLFNEREALPHSESPTRCFLGDQLCAGRSAIQTRSEDEPLRTTSSPPKSPPLRGTYTITQSPSEISLTIF